MPRKSLYLIDGHAQIYRAYYAPFRGLTAPSGEPTRATFVFCQMLLNLLRDRKPDYLAMVMDVSDRTVFRVQIDPEYKARRQPPPEDLEPQCNRIVSILEAMGVPILRQAGFEADDIMATLAARWAPDLDVYLVSRDKDLDQLLGDGVRMYDPGKDRVIDAAAMQAEKGYPPAKAVEAQMLTGDSVDNVKGVPGVGPKKAAALLAEYGDVAGIIAHADRLSPKLRDNLLQFAHRAEQVRQLVTLRRDVPVRFDLESATSARLRSAAVRPIFDELAFHRLREQLDAVLGGGASPDAEVPAAPRGAMTPASLFPATPSSEAPDVSTDADTAEARMDRGDYRLIDDEKELAALADRLRGLTEFAFDTETTALTPIDADLVGLSFAWQAGRACYVPLRGAGRTVPFDAVRAHLGPVFADAAIGKCGQNLKYDLGVLMAADLALAGIRFDTMLASFVLDATRRSHGIDALALDLLGIRKIPTTSLIGRGKQQLRFDQLDTARVCAYACEDADVAWRLKQVFEPQLVRAGREKLFYELEMPLVEVLAQMEHYGVALDTDLLARLSNEMADRLKQLTADIHAAAGRPFNIDSTKQVAEVLFDEIKLPVIKRTKTARSTDAEVLVQLSARTNHPVPRLLLQYRELSKLKGTYVDTLPEMISPRTGRVHCSFHQTSAVTGRLSSSDPNLQNVPIRTSAGAQIRRAFVPRPLEFRVPGSGFGDSAGEPGGPPPRQPGPGPARLAHRRPHAAHRRSQFAIRNPQSATPEPGTRNPEPDQWLLLTADYSQIELRVLAHFCKDEALTAAFHEDRDIHAFVASQIFGVPLEQVSKEQRGRAKTVNFGIIYGQTAYGLSRQTGMPVGEARRFIDTYFARYPRIREFLDQCIVRAKRDGYVETLLGRRRKITEINSRNAQARAAAERLAINTIVQGTAADIIKRAMISIHRRIRDERRPSRMLIQVHDELVFEVPPHALHAEARMIRDEMAGAIPLSVPIRVDVAAGPNWLDVQKVASNQLPVASYRQLTTDN